MNYDDPVEFSGQETFRGGLLFPAPIIAALDILGGPSSKDNGEPALIQTESGTLLSASGR